MKKIVKIGFPIICVIIVVGTFYWIIKTRRTIDELKSIANEANTSNTSTVQNLENSSNSNDI